MSQQINLYHAKFRKQKKRLSAREAALSLLLIVVSVGAYAGVQWQQNEHAAAQAGVLDKKVAAQQGVVDQLNNALKTRKKDAQLESVAARAEEQVASMRDVMQMVAGGALGNPDGYSEQFRALARQTVAGLWLTGFTLAGNAEENVIRGRVLTPELVATYLQRLNEEKTLQGQRFASLTISTPKEAAPTPAAAAAEAKSGSAPVAAPKAPRFLEFSVMAADAAAAKAASPQGPRP
jgi:hypothetical protein